MRCLLGHHHVVALRLVMDTWQMMEASSFRERERERINPRSSSSCSRRRCNEENLSNRAFMKDDEEEADEMGSHADAFLPPLSFPSPPSPCSDSDAPTSHAPSSGYSSCYDGDVGGASSEIDRYCSANSALGSASICSSLGNYNAADFFLGNNFNSNNFLGEDRLSDDFGSPACFSPSQPRGNFFSSNHADGDGTAGGCEVPGNPSASRRCDTFLSLSEHDDSLPRIRKASHVLDYLRGSSVEDPLGQEIAACDALDSLLPSGSDLKEIASLAGLGSYSLEMGPGCSPCNGINRDEQDDTSSGYDHSEGEDSVGEYSADAEDHLSNLCDARNLPKPDKLATVNPLAITSAVAFGSDDWDDFIREVGEDGLSPLLLEQDMHDLQQVADSKSEEKLSSLTLNHAINSSSGDLELKETAMDAADIRRRQPTDTNGHAQNVKSCASNDLSVNTKIVHLSTSLSAKHSAEGHLDFTNQGKIDTSLHKINEYVEVNRAADMLFIAKQDPSKVSTRIQISPVPVGSFSGRDLGSHDGDMIENQVGARISTLNSVVDFDQCSTLRTAFDGHPSSESLVEGNGILNEVKKEDANELYDEMVLEMEEILLGSGISHGPKINHGPVSHHSHHFRDGSSTASTSGTDDTYQAVQCSPKIDGVEVVGAKQKKGDVSFGERLIGVKEYTVYILRVWSANNQWEVERRYRDFFSLYRQLRDLFAAHGLSLPSPWSYVDKESRKFFGNASPDVVNERSALIQDCLRSVLSNRFPFGTPNPLLYFLNPGKITHDSSLFKAILPHSLQKLGGINSPKVAKHGESTLAEDATELGKTISLVLNNKPHKSMQQLLDLQHNRCAGCHEPFHAENTLLGELIQSLGRKKPRFCEYTSQLFCSSCHTNDATVLPAKVLHLWDFSLYPVSQLAKAYLESIYDQPMLCVSAVNPFLFSKVPALLHIMGVRKRIGAMFIYVKCPFRMSILKTLGSRRYLLESNDFFALRDLVDLSKGAFSAFPVMVDNISKRILEHITVQCLICYDSGVPCAARQSCDDPSDLIFPFQEAEAARCSSCGSVYHNPCFAKLIGCPCIKQSSTKKNAVRQERKSDGSTLKPSFSSSKQSADTILMGRPDKWWKSTSRKSSSVILMGSLPSTSS